MEMLLSMSVDDLKECMKEIGIKRFGDRHKIVEFVLREKRVYGNSMISQTVATVEEPKDHPAIIESLPQVENMETLTDNSGYDTDTSGCNLCKISTQHFCRKCNLPVCNLFCSIPDPSSDNEAHRIHKANNKRCIMKSSFECPSCEKIFDQPDDLEQHMPDHDQDSSLRLRSN